MLQILFLLGMLIGLFNILSGVISAIWLGVLGEWAVLGYGLLALMLGGYLIGIAMMPRFVFLIPFSSSIENKNKISILIVSILNSLYTKAIILIWCGIVLNVFFENYTRASEIPMLLWTYGVAVGPLVWLAQKDIDNDYSTMSLFLLQFSFIVAVIGILSFDLNFVTAIAIIAAFMLVNIIAETYLVFCACRD